MVLEVQGLNKSFRHPWNLSQIQVLFDVSFKIEKHSIVGFLGANGTGKTTTIKCLLGLLKYQSGQLKIMGEHHLAKSVKSQVGYLPERPYFYSYLTAHEFLTFYGQLSGITSKKELEKRIDELLELVGLAHAKNRFLHQFSKGMLQRVGMAQSLIHRPKLLILDEPLSGLDPDGRRQLVNIIKTTHEHEKTTIFFSSHLLDDIERLCRDLVVIRGGRVHFSGTKDEFVSRGKHSFFVRYQQNGTEQFSKVASLDLLQNEIDKIRNQGFLITGVEEEKLSLDRAFAEFNQNMEQP